MKAREFELAKATLIKELQAQGLTDQQVETITELAISMARAAATDLSNATRLAFQTTDRYIN